MEHYYCRNNYSNSNSYLLFASKIKMTKQINKKFLFSILVFIFLVLVSAFIIEHQLGHKPCKLCLYERIPYFLSILLIIKMLIIKKYERVTLLILFLVLICSTALSFYHFGIEQGFIEESLICDLNNENKSLTKEELLKELKEKTISCKDVTFRILGLSLATINTIISLLFSIITLKIFCLFGFASQSKSDSILIIANCK